MATGVAFASAARTTAQTGTTINKDAYDKGIIVYLNVTASAAGTGGLSVKINGIDPVSGTAAQLNAAPTAVTATGIKTYIVYPGTTTGGTQATSAPLPDQFRIDVGVGDSTSYTYSVGYETIK